MVAQAVKRSLGSYQKKMSPCVPFKDSSNDSSKKSSSPVLVSEDGELDLSAYEAVNPDTPWYEGVVKPLTVVPKSATREPPFQEGDDGVRAWLAAYCPIPRNVCWFFDGCEKFYQAKQDRSRNERKSNTSYWNPDPPPDWNPKVLPVDGWWGRRPPTVEDLLTNAKLIREKVGHKPWSIGDPDRCSPKLSYQAHVRIKSSFAKLVQVEDKILNRQPANSDPISIETSPNEIISYGKWLIRNTKDKDFVVPERYDKGSVSVMDLLNNPNGWFWEYVFDDANFDTWLYSQREPIKDVDRYHMWLLKHEPHNSHVMTQDQRERKFNVVRLARLNKVLSLDQFVRKRDAIQTDWVVPDKPVRSFILGESSGPVSWTFDNVREEVHALYDQKTSDLASETPEGDPFLESDSDIVNDVTNRILREEELEQIADMAARKAMSMVLPYLEMVIQQALGVPRAAEDTSSTDAPEGWERCGSIWVPKGS